MANPVTFTAEYLANYLGGEVIGDGAVPLTGFASAERARAGDLTFAEKDASFAAADASGASAVLIAGSFVSTTKVLIRVANPRVAAARAIPLFFPPEEPVPGIHPSAVIALSARVDATAQIGPGCVVHAGVTIGARSVLTGGNHVGRDCEIGDDARLLPNVVLYARTRVGHRVTIHAGTVIGSDGYGYVFAEGRHLKMPQVGNVIIQDDVEIGANTTIDRGGTRDTVIGEGTKIDNLVQIGHNCSIGRHCFIVSQTGISGSVEVGDYVMLGGQVGIADHLTIGEGARLKARSGVITDVPANEEWGGFPARPFREWLRAEAMIGRMARGGKGRQKAEGDE